MAEAARATDRLIGQALVKEGLLDEAQLNQLLMAQPKQKQRLGEAAVKLGFVSDKELAKLLAKLHNLPYHELSDDEELDFSAVGLVPETLARRYLLIVTAKEGDTVTVAMADPLDVRAIDAVRVETRCRLRKLVSSRTAILRALDRSYHASSRLEKSMDRLLAEEEEAVPEVDAVAVPEIEHGISEEADQLLHEASDAPVVQFVNLLLMRAIQDRASDIHIEPEEHTVTIRLRVDGHLREVTAPPKKMFQAITTRIKLLGNLDITERRLPQDGRFKFKVFDK